jgi:hypothetical protein
MPIDTEPSDKPIPPTPVAPTSFTSTSPQVIAGNDNTQIFPQQPSHLTTAELKSDGTSWVKVLTITAVLLLLLDAGVFGYNLWRGEANPDILGPLMSILNR